MTGSTWDEWRSRAVPVTSGELSVAGYDLGDPRGPVVTFLHGFPSSSLDVEPLLGRLPGRRVVAVDFPGFGASGKPIDHTYRIAGAADAVEAHWTSLGITATVLLAHDYGVSVAQELLARRLDGSLPVEVTGVVWTNGGLYPDLHRPTAGQQMLLDPEHGHEVAAAVDEELFRGGVAVTWGERHPLDEAAVHEMHRSMAESGGVARMAAHVSDADLEVHPPGEAGGRFGFVLSATEPTPEELAGDRWVPVPEDASAIVVRQYVADAAVEVPATLRIEPLDEPGTPAVPSDEAVAEQLTAMAWTIAKLATLHRTIDPGQIGAADTTPDNLYALGTFRLADGEVLEIDVVPPATRYWSVTLENIWHECIDVGRRRSSLTGAHAHVDDDGHVRIAVAAHDPGSPNWLDPGGRHRGFVILRWLDEPDPPEVSTSVRVDRPAAQP